MRTFMLASMVVASVVVSLVTFAPSSAVAAPAATGKRVAKRAGTTATGAGTTATGASPRVLPAPLPKADVLPPLPPVPRDVTAITTVTSASIGVGAGGPGDPGAPAAAPAGAPETLPPLPAGEPGLGASAAPAARDVVVMPRSTASAREVKPTGWVIQLGSGALMPATSFISGLRPLTPGVAFELRLGYYATPRFGILTGVRASYGHEVLGCAGCNAGYSTQVPVILQFAEDRTHGVYGELGLGFATNYSGPAGGGATYSFSSPVEAKVGAGYRFAGAHSARPATTADLNVGVDVGSIGSAELKTKSGSVVSDDGDEPTHVVVALSLLLHFSL